MTRERHNPIDMIKYFWPTADVSHITYDPSLRKGDFDIIRQSSHDGTLIFSDEIIQNTVITLANMQAYHASRPPDWDMLDHIKYVVGDLKIAIVYGTVDLPAGRYPGQKERTRIPVKCEYIYKELA